MAELFDITHNAGNLDDYSSTVTDGGDLSAAVAAALASTAYGLNCLIDDTTAIYGVKTFTQLTATQYRYRLYVDPNSLTMADEDQFTCCVIAQATNSRSVVNLRYTVADGYQIRTAFETDGGTQQSNWFDVNDAEHYVEVRVVYASSAVASNGTVDLWIDGVNVQQATGLDIYDISKPDRAYLGAVAGLDAGTSGTLYLDELILNDDGNEIGPIPTAQVTLTLETRSLSLTLEARSTALTLETR